MPLRGLFFWGEGHGFFFKMMQLISFLHHFLLTSKVKMDLGMYFNVEKIIFEKQKIVLIFVDLLEILKASPSVGENVFFINATFDFFGDFLEKVHPDLHHVVFFYHPSRKVSQVDILQKKILEGSIKECMMFISCTHCLSLVSLLTGKTQFQNIYSVLTLP